jgi:hypothetical protein
VSISSRFWLLYNEWIIEEIWEDIKKFLAVNEQENTT